MIALLACVLGIWLKGHYLAEPQGYAPGTEEIALVKIDRDLRLADAMAADPRWLRWLAGVEDPGVARQNALKVFENLAAENAITPAGLEAFAVVKSVQEGVPLYKVLKELTGGRLRADFAEISERLANHQGTWWHARLIETWEKTRPPAASWRQAFETDSLQLRNRALVARSSVWLIGLAGLGFIPRTLRELKRGLSARLRGYGGAWPIQLGLLVFLMATLAWIGFTTTLGLGIHGLPDLHPALGIILDSAARLLPPLIAIGLLFRRPSHAGRVLGFGKPFAAQTILGLFALLMIGELILRRSIGSEGSSQPGGGLSIGEAGLWGLAFAITSACVLAPLAEETLYRGVLFRSLWNRLGVIPSAFMSSAVFALFHFYDGYGLASVGIFGFSCALLYAATGSLGASIVLHMLYNSAIKIPNWLIYHGSLG